MLFESLREKAKASNHFIINQRTQDLTQISLKIQNLCSLGDMKQK